ncbi:MAG: hypothetical protein KC656_35350, partial [Myxococcales bacterium]|nr:hypothetical protein [Myxococcales bacterium]
MWLVVFAGWAGAATLEVVGPCGVVTGVEVDPSGKEVGLPYAGDFGYARYGPVRLPMDFLAAQNDLDLGSGDLGTGDLLVLGATAETELALGFLFPIDTWASSGPLPPDLDLLAATEVFSTSPGCPTTLADSVLDITGLTPLDRAVAAANTAYPLAAPVHPGAPTRLRPSTLDAALQVPADLLVAAGCEVSQTYGWLGGA